VTFVQFTSQHKSIWLNILILSIAAFGVACTTETASDVVDVGTVPSATASSTVATSTSTAISTPDTLDALSTNLTDSCIEHDEFHADLDYFPDKVFVRTAENFAIEYHDSYKILTINGTDSTDTRSYTLVQCGADAPMDLEHPIINIPIRSMFLSSSTQYPGITILGSKDVVTGVAQTGYITSTELMAHVIENNVTEFAANFEVDTESVIAAKPEVLLSSGFPDPSYSVLRDLEIPVIDWTDWLETNPIGRAEWMYVTAALLNREKIASAFMDEVEKEYARLSAMASEQSHRPKVMVGSAFQGTFYAPGGGSYVAQLVDDAGGDYIWRTGEDTGSLYLDIETVLVEGQTASIWIDAPSHWINLKQGLIEDPRYADLNSIQMEQVWNHTRLVNENGADDYFERAASRPDLLLADLMKIIHPEIMSNHSLEWYLRLPPQ
jgi:iron complex transport system substrate-binding protein